MLQFQFTPTIVGRLSTNRRAGHCVRSLLTLFNLAGAVVTIDAMHTLAETAQQIIDAGGDYVFTVKNNTKTLRRMRCSALLRQ